MRAWLLAALSAAGPTAALGTSEAPPPARLLVQTERSSLSKGLADWQAHTVQVSRHWSVREVAELAVGTTRRFGLDDTQLGAGYSRALSATLTGAVHAQWSPTHRVLPRQRLSAGVQYEFSRGWLVHGGVRHSRYEGQQVTQLPLALEHYRGNWRLKAGWSPARALGRNAQTFDLAASWYYADDHSLGLVMADGKEATQLGAGQVVLSNVREMALTGKHRLSAPAGTPTLLWSLHRARQGDLYTRTGASIGLQFVF